MQAKVKILLHGVRVRDCVLVTICALFVYLLRARERYDLIPVWRKHINTEVAFANNRFPMPAERLPIPIITDIDDDEREEIVLISGDFELQICNLPQQEVILSARRRLPELKDCTSVEMVLDGSHRPVALETGYLSSPRSPNVARSQVIVVVFDDWTVHCYDNNLHLIWSQMLMDLNGRHGYVMNSVGILITPHVLNKCHNGTVLVGASFAHSSHSFRKQSTIARGGLPSDHDDSLLDRNDEITVDEKFRHFSTFALNGGNGKIHWHHLPGDFEHKSETASYHWKLNLKHEHLHAGEVYWTKYADNLLQHLPHSWRSSSDTRFDLAELRRTQVVVDEVHLGSDSDKRQLPSLAPLSDIIGLYDHHVEGRPYGGMRAHSRHEHIKWPNAIVIHIDTGLEVLSLQTGRPLTRLSLTSHSTSSVFADINLDNTVEEVRADFALKCNADVSTVNPRPHALFTGPLCESPFWWTGFSLSSMFQSSDIVNEDTHLAVTPLVVPRVARSYGILNHLLGQSLPSEQKGFDSIFITSSGRMTSYSPFGEPNWQTVGAEMRKARAEMNVLMDGTDVGIEFAELGNVLPTSWSQVALQSELNHNFDSTEKGQVYEWAFKPSMKAFSMQVFGKKTAALVTGWDSVALVDLRDGHLIGEHSLPCQPIADPVIGDLDRNGWNDFIIVCPDGMVGFEIHKTSSFVHTSIVTVTVALSMLLLMWCCIQPDTIQDPDVDQQILT